MENLQRVTQAVSTEINTDGSVVRQENSVPKQREPLEKVSSNRICAVPIAIADIVIDSSDKAKTHKAKNAREVHKKICRVCPNRIKCLQYAIDIGEEQGIWGGLTANERRDLKRRALGSLATYS